MLPIDSRVEPLWSRICRTIAKAFIWRPPASTAEPSNWAMSVSHKAALRCAPENSSAKIFIINLAFVFSQHLESNEADVPGWDGRFRAEPAFNPFHQRHPRGMVQVIFQAGADDLFARVQPIQIQVKKRQATSVMFVHEGKGRGLHTARI